MTKNTCTIDWCDGELHTPPDGCNGPGGWHCVTCHEGLPNNWMAELHEEANPDHQVGWSCGEHLQVERV